MNYTYLFFAFFIALPNTFYGMKKNFIVETISSGTVAAKELLTLQLRSGKKVRENNKKIAPKVTNEESEESENIEKNEEPGTVLTLRPLSSKTIHANKPWLNNVTHYKFVKIKQKKRLKKSQEPKLFDFNELIDQDPKLKAEMDAIMKSSSSAFDLLPNS